MENREGIEGDGGERRQRLIGKKVKLCILKRDHTPILHNALINVVCYDPTQAFKPKLRGKQHPIYIYILWSYVSRHGLGIRLWITEQWAVGSPPAYQWDACHHTSYISISLIIIHLITYTCDYTITSSFIGV